MRGDLSKKHGLPLGSCVIITPTAYLTDAAWIECLLHICKGICQMEVIKEHLDWLVALFLDDFSSRLQARGYSTFNEYKIGLLVEDGDTSQCNQAFDQITALGVWLSGESHLKGVLYWGGHNLVNFPSLAPPLRLCVCTYLALSNWRFGLCV